MFDAGAAPVGIDGQLSEARFARYLTRYDGDRKLALRLCAWNLAARTALWWQINILEIAVRNAVHDKLVERTGRGGRLADSRVHFCHHEQDAIDSVIDRNLDVLAEGEIKF